MTSISTPPVWTKGLFQYETNDTITTTTTAKNPMLTIPQPSIDLLLTAPKPPANWGEVIPNVYRSSYPAPTDLPYLQSMGIKTILCLVETPPSEEYAAFIQQNNIRRLVLPLSANKDSADNIPAETMHLAISTIANDSYHPLLVHCNKGKHRTGCTVACYRKMCGWGAPDILGEYGRYAGDKARYWDEVYIRNFWVPPPAVAAAPPPPPPPLIDFDASCPAPPPSPSFAGYHHHRNESELVLAMGVYALAESSAVAPLGDSAYVAIASQSAVGQDYKVLSDLSGSEEEREATPQLLGS